MKKRATIIVLTTLLIVALFSGCSTNTSIHDEPVPLASTYEVEMTKLEAEEIALEHAGVASNHISFLYTKHETEEGAPRYEVSFRTA